MEAVAVFLSNALVQYAEFVPTWLIAIFAIVGTFHVILVPFQTFVLAVVMATPSKKDDELYEQVTTHKYFAMFKAVIKWVSGIDLDKIKKKKEEKDATK